MLNNLENDILERHVVLTYLIKNSFLTEVVSG